MTESAKDWANGLRRRAAGICHGVGWHDAPWGISRFEPGENPLATAHPVGDIASMALAAVGVAATAIARHRGRDRAPVTINRRAAALAMAANNYLRVDGKAPESWPALTGFYEAADGWVYLHGGFPLHRQRLLAALEAPADREGLAATIADRTARDIEDLCLAANTCGRRVRTEDEWTDHPASRPVAAKPLISISPFGQAGAVKWTSADMPLAGIRVLDLSRVLAGPTIGRTLAEHGAEVMRISAPGQATIEAAVIDTGYGKRAAHADLATPRGRRVLTRLIRGADVFIDGYRPGSLAQRGFGPKAINRLRPGIIHLDLSAFGATGTWGGQRGYDSLVQAATGLAEGDPPKLLPCQPLDYLAGYLGAFAVMRALLLQAETGHGAQIELTLTGMAHWFRRMTAEIGRESDVPDSNAAFKDIGGEICTLNTAFGRIEALRPALDVPWRPRTWAPPVPLGHDPPEWT